jgi:DNA transformation protein and related proteins
VALSDSDFVKELFAAFGPVSVRRMFGGAGIFADGLMIGLISGEELYLKADDRTAPSFEAEGMTPFRFGAKGRRVVMSYWRMPERLFDDPEELAKWARAAWGAAERAAAKGKKAPPVGRGGKKRDLKRPTQRRRK